MSLSKTIRNNVRKAFKAAGDCVKTAKFTHTSNGDFSFSTGQVSKTVGTEKSVSCLLIAKELKPSSEQKYKSMYKLLLNAEDISEAEIGDIVVIENTTYKVLPGLVSNSFTIEAYVVPL